MLVASGHSTSALTQGPYSSCTSFLGDSKPELVCGDVSWEYLYLAVDLQQTNDLSSIRNSLYYSFLQERREGGREGGNKGGRCRREKGRRRKRGRMRMMQVLNL